jgi:hypothetical protein
MEVTMEAYSEPSDPRDEAFAAALRELFKANPLWEGAHEMYIVVRGSAVRKARRGGYMDPRGRQDYWRGVLRDDMAPDWRVPADELIAIHMLIYG